MIDCIAALLADPLATFATIALLTIASLLFGSDPGPIRYARMAGGGDGVTDELDAAELILRARKWPGDFSDEEAVLRAAIQILDDDYNLDLEAFAHLLGVLAPYCCRAHVALSGQEFSGFAVDGAFLIKALPAGDVQR